ncbi:MAG TPA: hypothetical protein VER96_04185 [Polyangiaceae bacterium]|nr:hypothetical protein [Polyangiaceae bacterium]
MDEETRPVIPAGAPEIRSDTPPQADIVEEQPAARNYTPFANLAPMGPDGLFSAAQLDYLVEVPHQVEAAALGG